MAQWFKFFGQDFLTDPKMLMLSENERLCWITLLCLAATAFDPLADTDDTGNGKVTLGNGAVLPMLAHVDVGGPDNCSDILIKLENLGLVKVKGDEITVVNFLKRQAPPLTNAERQAKFKARKRLGNEKVTEGNEEVTRSNANRIEENRIEIDSPKRPAGGGGSPRPVKTRDPELRNQALDLINHWAASWEKTFGKKADITSWSRYLKQAMPLVKANGLDAMKALCDQYFLLFDDKYVKENSWPLGLFLSDGIINKLKNQ